MRAFSPKPSKEGICQASLVTQRNCRRKAVVKRFKMLAKGVRVVSLCKKCDAAFGHLVGDIQHESSGLSRME
jgi:hypothetical protein